jgi:tetratricopeptide (TPR) repeat protein
LETKLTGDDHLVLTSNPSQLAAKLKEVPGMTVVKLWDVPFRTLHDQLNLGKAARHQEALAFEPFAHRPALWKARTRHFQGRRDANAKSQDEAIDDHREAAKFYTDKTVRPPDRQIARTTSSEKRRVETTAKSAATYWLGLLSFDEGKYDVAADWLGSAELSEKESPWSAGARYNLARTLEAQSRFDEAAKILNDDTSPQQHGNRIRAKRLQALAEKAKENESE